MAKIGETSRLEPLPPEHPEDIAMEAEGKAYGAKYATEFCKAHRAELAQLISTYGDGDAEQLLTALREKFWARLWVSADGKTDRTLIREPLTPSDPEPQK